VAPAGPPWLHGSRYLIPLGLTFLAYSHASYLGRSREINFWRLLGVTLLYADILPRAIFVSGSLAPRFLTLIMCVGVGFPGVLFRTQLYLLAGTGLMLITLGAIVIREIFEVTQRGLLSLLFLGLFLILLAAIFEGARERLQHSLARLQERFGDWD